MFPEYGILIVETIPFVLGSMRMRDPDDENRLPKVITQTAPSPMAMPLGPFPTSTVATTVLVLGSILETVRSPLLVTQTAPSPASMTSGFLPTGTLATT